MLNIRY